MVDLTITHTDAEGTILEGTARGDGSAEVVKGLGWRWGRSIDSWYVPRSRNVPPKRPLIERTAQALETAGFAVAVEVDTTAQDRVVAEERRSADAAARAARLTARAEREQARSDERWEAGRRLAASIPFGQPILLGHHSQRSAERDRDRIRGHIDASCTHQERADAAAAGARAAAFSTAARHSPTTVANRIERLEVAIRADERALQRPDWAPGYPPDAAWRVATTERLATARADLEHWRAVRAQQIADGEATNYGPDTVRKGDAVKIRGSWYSVVRANTKSVTVQTEYSWTRRTPWHNVADHRPATPG